jgi:hypothetical protein
VSQATGAPSAPGHGQQAYVILGGLAWGLVVTTFESLSQPPLELGAYDFLIFYSRILLHYGASGILIAWLTARISRLEPGFAKWVAMVSMLAAATALALLIDRLSNWYVPWWRNNLMTSLVPPVLDLAPHMAWMFGVYGGLYVLTFFFLRSEALTRERLRVTELARIGADARMDQALRENRTQAIAPDLLLEALAELARRYNDNHRRADRLLDMLVKLLRLASSPASAASAGRTPDLANGLDKLRAELGHASIPDQVNMPEQEADHERIGTE